MGNANQFSLGEFLFQWQSLTAGLLGLFGALITVLAILRQVKLQKKHFERQNEARWRASRATLVIPLNKISSQCSERAKFLNEMIDLEDDGDKRFFLSKISSTLTMSTDCLLQIREAIELGNDDLAGHLSFILQRQQVLSSRVDGFLDEDAIIRRRNIIRLIVMNLEIYTRATLVFPYVRFESETLQRNLLNRDMQNSAKLLHYSILKDRELANQIDDEFPQARPRANIFSRFISRLLKR